MIYHQRRNDVPKHPDYRFFTPQEQNNSVQEEGSPLRLTQRDTVRAVMLDEALWMLEDNTYRNAWLISEQS